ncbi:MAG TPA: hypothetical protein PL151_10640 [Phycisphaerae bacterium]|nr:hypothetical protein [Phycisphaerae bacterium]HOQ87216.1 hypothetical protein [Phycisphaerae bacterium]HPU25866.1 hypothetical protein [Phycisphaerae bacterium]HPZ98632.1 hypothetical protein [Phycisphaerae bacterium]HQE28209.1 hypothetical protein [Phycisphaerae bacterium]
MASDCKCISPLLLLAAVLGVSTATSGVRAADGDVLLAYESVLATTPEGQGWIHEGRSLAADCPNIRGDLACWYQGSQDLNADTWPDNNCRPGIGCHKKQPFTEHYNAPDPLADATHSSYTEWIAFDDGNNAGYRPLIIPDSMVPHSPPWGAPGFVRAPLYPVLRVVTGDGNNMDATLPAGPGNHRNMGKAKIRKGFTVPDGVTALTLVVKAAAGPRAAGRHFVELRAFQRRFAFGVDGTPGSADYGKLTLVDATNQLDETHYAVAQTLFSRTVQVAQPGVAGPHAGEFFTLRVVVRSNGQFDAYLNETTDQHAWGTCATTIWEGPANEVQLTPVPGDDTMWFDSVHVFEGEVPVSCPDPVVDSNRDGQVDADDMLFWMSCANGPNLPIVDSFECRCMDDGDGDLDMADFAILQRCLSVGGALDPACDD